MDRITIKFAEIGPPAGWKQQGMFAPTRWLLELYPIDEILASELKLGRTKITFEMMPIGSPAYEVVAMARDGSELFKRTFEPAVVERAFFDRFPDYEKVRVTTGWIKADVAARTVLNERTIWESSTEAPDETARGDWMKLVANAGLQWDKAILEYLVQGRHEIERQIDPFWGGVSLTMTRPRPPKPAEEKPTTAEPGR